MPRIRNVIYQHISIIFGPGPGHEFSYRKRSNYLLTPVVVLLYLIWRPMSFFGVLDFNAHLMISRNFDSGRVINNFSYET
jgi:hypothetical protein